MDQNEKKYPVDKAYGSYKVIYRVLEAPATKKLPVYCCRNEALLKKKKRICDQKLAAVVQNVI